MLAKAEMYAFVPTPSIDQVRAFYQEVLGLPVTEEGPGRVVLDAGGSPVVLVEVPHFVTAQHTVVGWNVDDIEAAVGELGERGVAFERYDEMDQDELGLWTPPDGSTRIAWFKDPVGNVLSLSERP